MAARYAKLGASKPHADTDAISLAQITTTPKNVRFSNEADADYDDPELDYDSDEAGNHETLNLDVEPVPDYGEPEADYDLATANGQRTVSPRSNGARPKYGVPVLPPPPGRAAGNLRHAARSAGTEHDLSAMENLNEVSILRVLEKRFKQDVIQVYMYYCSVIASPLGADDQLSLSSFIRFF